MRHTCTLTQFCSDPSTSGAQNTRAGEPLPRRPGPAAARAIPYLEVPHELHWWITHPTLNLPDPSPGRIDPRSAGLGVSGEPSAAGAPSPVSPAAARSPFHPKPPDPESTRTIRSRPPDPNPAAGNQTYRFALHVLLKSPSLLLISTRSLNLFKNIYTQAQFLTLRPPNFFNFEPAIQPLSFCELDPRINVYLHFSPQF